jgi:hypothetical protein
MVSLLDIALICMYPDRHRTKCCRNSRCEPQFCEGVGFAHLACRFLEPERALTTLRLSPPFTHMSLFRLLRAGSGPFTIRNPIAILSHSLARLERMPLTSPQKERGKRSGGVMLFPSGGELGAHALGLKDHQVHRVADTVHIWLRDYHSVPL